MNPLAILMYLVLGIASGWFLSGLWRDRKEAKLTSTFGEELSRELEERRGRSKTLTTEQYELQRRRGMSPDEVVVFEVQLEEEIAKRDHNPLFIRREYIRHRVEGKQSEEVTRDDCYADR